MLIRAATEADRDSIAALHLASWRDSYGGVLPDSVLRDELPGFMAAKWALRRFDGPDVTLVAERDGLLGFVCALTDRAPPLIDNLHVRPGHRGGGVGGRLLRAANSALAARGFDGSTLTVLEQNTRAHRFYLAQGGTDVGRVRESLAGRPVEARRILFDLSGFRSEGAPGLNAAP
ncbi:GNAT family N-acetyltransferase [Jannaschia seohaensis]|uniref:Ribosomal protein S18 acetylase RimI n=1 Tax=Jannaschia seohaensis TaxID=475081 RepID=A0A2Y9C8U0_9RHOB|nr:GNAT family N-acetyltransferase [Jannaschia seohaensis]PWJ14499.1 ribosomal protein S18 acetylase RimI-like enzyme [Jannaschia seohaensis]SSA50263.1 Ribosomal protein S18 acetylase RimI [Jannaschia seohaensis]